MEVQVSIETAKKLNDLAVSSGRAPNEIVEDALAGYLEEVAAVRKTLDSRYDDLKSGRVKSIDGEEAFRQLRENSERRRSSPRVSLRSRSPRSSSASECEGHFHGHDHRSRFTFERPRLEAPPAEGPYRLLIQFGIE
jgi:hypothetical protein